MFDHAVAYLYADCMRYTFLVLALAGVVVGGCKQKTPAVAKQDQGSQADAVLVPAGNVVRAPKAVQDAFAAYLAAAQAKRGAEAADYVDSATIAWHERVRTLALSASRDELKRTDFASRLAAIELRAAMTRADLEKLDGKGLVTHKGDQGRLSATGLDGVGDVVITGDTATGPMLIQGVKGPALRFAAENGRWRYKALEMIQSAAKGSQEIWARSGQSEDESIVLAVSKMSGKTLTDTVWHPPK